MIASHSMFAAPTEMNPSQEPEIAELVLTCVARDSHNKVSPIQERVELFVDGNKLEYLELEVAVLVPYGGGYATDPPCYRVKDIRGKWLNFVTPIAKWTVWGAGDPLRVMLRIDLEIG